MSQALILYTVKVVRIMVIWIVLYVIDKIWQDMYIQSLLKSETTGIEQKTPSLWPIIIIALGIEAVFMLVLLLILVMVASLYGGTNTTFIIDRTTLFAIGVDYAMSSTILILIGATVASIAQSKRLFRFGDDGMRGIRATCNMLLVIAAIVIAIPWFALVVPAFS